MSSKITATQIRQLKEETGAPVMRVKAVLEEMLGDLPADATPQALQAGTKKAKELLDKEGFEKAAKRESRETTQGKVFTYTHHTGKIVSVVELLCETDFVAKNELFETLGKDLALQVASMGEKDLAAQDFIKDPSRKMADLIKDVIVKTGENIKVDRALRIELGIK